MAIGKAKTRHVDACRRIRLAGQHELGYDAAAERDYRQALAIQDEAQKDFQRLASENAEPSLADAH